jgi:AAA domain
MTGLFDRGALEAALACAFTDPARIGEIVAANGGALLDFGEIRTHHALAHHIADLAAKGKPFNVELAASAVATATGSERGDVLVMINGISARSNPPALPLFLDCLRSLKWRRGLAALGEQAQNGCRDSELREAAERAMREIESAVADSVRLEPLTFSAWNPEQPPPVAFGDGVGDAILAHGDLVVFAGDSGAGKSLSILDLGIAWATRAAWLGFRCATAPGRVLILSSDGDGVEPVRARVCRLGLGRGLEPAALDGLPLRVIPADGFNLDNPAGFAALKAIVRDFDPDLIGLETLTSLAGPDRDLNANADASDFIVRRLRPLQPRQDGSRRTLILGHHPRKKSGQPGANALRDRVANSFYVVAGIDSVIGFEPGGERAFTCRIVKPSRWGIRFPGFQARIDGEPPAALKLIRTGTVEPTVAEQEAEGRRVLAALRSLAGSGGAVKLADLKRALGVESKQKGACKRIERAVARLVKLGAVLTDPNSRGVLRLPVERAE